MQEFLNMNNYICWLDEKHGKEWTWTRSGNLLSSFQCSLPLMRCFSAHTGCKEWIIFKPYPSCHSLRTFFINKASLHTQISLNVLFNTDLCVKTPRDFWKTPITTPRWRSPTILVFYVTPTQRPASACLYRFLHKVYYSKQLAIFFVPNIISVISTHPVWNFI